MIKMLSSVAALLLLFALSPAAAQSGVIEDDFVGCLTDAYFDDYTMAVTSNNWAQRDELMESACYELEGLEYSLVKKSFMGARIDVTIDGDRIRLTTTPDAIQ